MTFGELAAEILKVLTSGVRVGRDSYVRCSWVALSPFQDCADFFATHSSGSLKIMGSPVPVSCFFLVDSVVTHELCRPLVMGLLGPT